MPQRQRTPAKDQGTDQEVPTYLADTLYGGLFSNEEALAQTPAQDESLTPTIDSAENEDSDDEGSGAPGEWNSAPALQFKIGDQDVTLDLKEGVGVELDFDGWKFPKDDFKKEHSQRVQLVPAAGVIFNMGAGGGVALGGKVAFKAVKQEGDDGETVWGVEAEGAAFAKTEIWGELGIGGFFGVKGANVSASFYTKAKMGAEADFGVAVELLNEGGDWTGSLAFPFEVEGKLAAEVGIRADWEFLFWDGNFGRFRFGEWVFATGGMSATPRARWPGPIDDSTIGEPYLNWGTAPDPQKVDDGYDRPQFSSFSYFDHPNYDSGGGESDSPDQDDASADAGGGGGKDYCFPAGTLVHTPDGLQPIEHLDEGDQVTARDPKTGAELTATVRCRRQHEGTFDMLHFGVGPDRIVTTPGHRVHTGDFWHRADDLRAGMALHGGRMLEEQPRPMRLVDTVVYNLEVDRARGYLVGKSGVWVRDH